MFAYFAVIRWGRVNLNGKFSIIRTEVDYSNSTIIDTIVALEANAIFLHGKTEEIHQVIMEALKVSKGLFMENCSWFASSTVCKMNTEILYSHLMRIL